ncbi:MAG: hypothetical protein ACI9K9_001197, partial [Neolewinella sp.]
VGVGVGAKSQSFIARFIELAPDGGGLAVVEFAAEGVKGYGSEGGHNGSQIIK